MAKYYTKHKNRYYPAVGLDQWMHNPADGVWLVLRNGHGRSISLIARLGEVPDHATHAAFARHRDTVVSVISSFFGKQCSAVDMADAIIKAVATKETNDGD